MNSDFWKEKNVLVTGAGGFKGSHMVKVLCDANARVISLIRDYEPRSYFETQNLGKKSIVNIGDLKDKRKISDIISKYEINTIFHLGAQPLVTTALLNPLETLETNIMGTVNVLESARKIGNVQEIVVVSSDKAYGNCKKLPYSEEERLEGKAPYEVSKSCADLISQMYSNVYGMPITLARCSNVFGPGDLNMNRIVPGVMDAIIRKKLFKIRSDGKFVREYIYVKDAIEGYILLAENIDKTKGEAFNIASKNIMSVLEIIENISNVLNKKVEYEILNQAETEIYEQYLDGSKIKNLLGWEAKTDFAHGINETYNWYKSVLN